MKTIILFFLVFLAVNITAEEFVNDTSRIESNDFYNSIFFEPNCFESSKIDSLVPESDFLNPIKISESDFNSLNAIEHFIHSFYYPEWYVQSCSNFSKSNDSFLRISPFIKYYGGGLRMSERQRNALIKNRDSILLLIKECIERNGKVYDNFKSVIVSMRLIEIIPTLIETIKNQKRIKDPYILSSLCQLMRYDFDPFINSEIYKILYPKVPIGILRIRSESDDCIPFTKNNYDKIVDFANDYYKFLKNQPSEYIEILGGSFILGEKEHPINPLHKVDIETFSISRYEITNKQFNQFVERTGYVTLAEKNKDAFVFRLGLDEYEWFQDSTANWRFPNGIEQLGIEKKMNHPVTCISFIDAEAYCNWAGVRLPTFEEWEIASRGGQSESKFYFGDSLKLLYNHANVWHGKTHLMEYEGEDYLTTSPVGSYQANPFGLYDIYGNVFEFCSSTPETFNEFKNIAVTRGGSWWCSFYACGFFNSVDIGRVQKAASFSNNGFRVVL